MRFPRGAREAGLALLTAGLVSLAGLGLGDGTVLRSLETASLDLRFRVRGALPPGPEIALVMVDDRSLAALGRWPLSRRVFATALGALGRAGAKVVLFDLLFAEPEQPIPPALRDAAHAAAVGLPPDVPLRDALTRLADDDPDGAFADAMHQAGTVLLPIAFNFTGAPSAVPDALADSAYAAFVKSPVEPVFPLRPVSAVLPIARFVAAAAGLGAVNIAFDRDGAPRYDYLALPFEGDFYPSLPVRAAAQFLGLAWDTVGVALGEGVELGDTRIPTDPAMRLVVNYRGPRGTFPTYSFLDLVEGRLPPDALRGRLVLVGASIVGLGDSYEAPFGSTPLPGTERMANLIDSILHRDFIAESPPPWAALALVGVLVLAAATGAAAAALPTRFVVLAGALPLAAWGALAQAAFARGLWLPVVQPMVALAAAVLAVLLFRYWVVDREGRRVRVAFRHYLAPELVNVLAAHPERLRLGGETRNMTLLFCDVRGFTAISEGFKADPQRLTQLINRFLTPMTEIIMARRGTIDKYMGDCIMAFWNAPLDDPGHADHACASALAMMAALETVNRALADEAAAEGRACLPLRVGIGLNTGDCVVGNMGSAQRFDYSVLGDAVNLASRLEGLSKLYGVDIVLGEATRAAAPGWATLELDRVAVKGKREPVRIYALRGDDAHARSAAFVALAERHRAMLAAYRARDWAGARAALADCAAAAPDLADLYALYDARISDYQASPPPPDWDGVFVAMEK